MRPIELEMTAFGSYAETTRLPFDALKSGLYLVTGDTGAGKTTIFDAIMFALYGVASGNDRKGDMLHCDHVPKSTDTVVKLRFAQGEKEYTVTRRIHYSKKRGTENQYNAGVLGALLEEPGREPLEGSDRVKERCEQLLGLNADQFRKIIMLAQGEFKDFLRADSDKKNEILGQLFDNAAYLYYQNLLLGARDELRNRRSRCGESLRLLLQTEFAPPEDSSPEERELYQPEHPELIENLRRLAEREQAELEALRRSRSDLQEAIAACNEQKGAAEGTNSLLSELERERARLLALEAQRSETDGRRQRLERADAAFRKALPAKKQAELAYEALNTLLAEIEVLEAGLAERRSALDAAQRSVDADAAAREELEAVSDKIRTIERQLPRYRELEARQKDKTAADAAAGRAGEALSAQEAALAQLSAELLSLREKLAELENAEAEVQSGTFRSERANELLNALTGESGIRAEWDAIRRQEKRLEEAKGRLLALTGEAAEASRRHAALYQSFIAGQAGLLADGLRAELEEKGAADCPVCGSRLCRSHLPQLALRREDTPGEDAVNEAKERLARAERERGEQQTKTEALAAAAEARRQALAERARRLLPDCGGWEQLSDGEYLRAAARKAAQDAADAQAALAAARSRQAERERCRKLLQQKEETGRILQARIETLRAEEQAQSLAGREADAAIGEIRKQLWYGDAPSALAEKKKLEEQQQALSLQLRAHADALAAEKQRCAAAEGSLREKRGSVEKLSLAQSQALADMERVFRETGFQSPAELERALAPMGEQDGDAWLKNEQLALSTYEADRKHTQERVEKLCAQTEGKAFTDLDALTEHLAALNESYNRANDQCVEKETCLKKHQTVLERAAEAKKTLAATDGAWRRLENLAALAGGVNSEGGKLSFDRYVMGAVFREILEAANRRMERMSGGRYELIHKVGADRRNAKAGLEIEVLDHNTGLQRGASTLSGGETFFTSLALALGLSDVVQNHAGGKRMDALFIDEGFGTLSDDVLDKALEVLGQLTEGNRLVGIISHVDKLDESIPQKIRVKNGEKGSSLSLELA